MKEKKEKGSRKKHSIAVVNGVLFRRLIGTRINNMTKIIQDESEKKCYFFTNSKRKLDPTEIFKKLEEYVNKSNSEEICFGILVMKNNKEYYFVCEIDTLYINQEITHIQTKPVVNFSGKLT
jgi:ribosome biogenesis GTPase A